MLFCLNCMNMQICLNEHVFLKKCIQYECNCKMHKKSVLAIFCLIVFNK